MKKFLCLLACCLLAACGGGSHHHEEENNAEESCGWLGMLPKIYNGATCDATRSPVVRLIIISGDGLGLCSGTLIDSTTVLTAAHCFDDPAQSVVVSFGEVDERIVIPAIQWFTYPEYDGEDPFGDVAIVKLQSGMPNWPTVSLLFSRVAQKNETGTIFGYGDTGEGDDDDDTTPLHAGFAHVTDADDELIYMKYRFDSDTCEGDSGGPLILMQNGTPAVAGITSSGTAEECGYGGRSYFAAIQKPEIQSFIRLHASDDLNCL